MRILWDEVNICYSSLFIDRSKIYWLYESYTEYVISKNIWIVYYGYRLDNISQKWNKSVKLQKLLPESEMDVLEYGDDLEY